MDEKTLVKGRVKQVEGMSMEVAGKLAGNKALENRGKIQNALGAP